MAKIEFLDPQEAGKLKTTGCPTILFTLLFLEFRGFLGVYKLHLGHFSTALFV